VMYSHLGAFPPQCPLHPRFFQACTRPQFEKAQHLNMEEPMILYFRYRSYFWFC
jgi:hypothetical protein